ncbi:MAG: hypothetical protein HC936_11000 [Leptolyngbyaceae cyanobacterium SU_3_3]|nr:hypothetical protein [Leptolyngbyaceae cyanobacterium SU_3_3]NJR50577.1 hypothetical protein [Leptolyngbyaceae cyanobacterium CSU_1_3]
MRYWRQFWHTLMVLGQHNPPQIVEAAMLTLAAALVLIWASERSVPYLLLSWIYTVGACVLILVRETVIPSAHARLNQTIATIIVFLVSPLLFLLYQTT